MTLICAYLLASIFVMLSVFHFYWAMGGAFGFDDALPQHHSGKVIRYPSKLVTFIVGLLLLGVALFFLVEMSLIHINLPTWISKYLPPLIAFLFLIRAIGDFNYVGYFKKIRDTNFSRKDTRLYSPLCLLISFLTILYLLGEWPVRSTY